MTISERSSCVVPSHRAPGRDITITVIREAEEFDTLAAEWNYLLDRCDASVYQSYEWQRLWWKYFSDDKSRLHIILLHRNAELTGIAPFYIETTRTFGVIPLRRIKFIGQGPSDYLDVLFLKGSERECATSIAEHLSAQSSLFDIVHLEDFSDRLPNHSLLFDALKATGLRGDHFINEYCPRTQLKGNWEQTLASFAKNTRREVRRRARNIHKAFAVEFEIITNENAVQDGLEDFICLHQFKWINTGHTGEFAGPRYESFHRELVQVFARMGWIQLAFLHANGERVAALYCFLFRNDLAIYLTGNKTSSDVYKFSPGRVLTAYCMEQAVIQGKSVCDFMRGNEPYKYEMDGKDIPNWAMLLYNRRSFTPKLRYRIELLIGSLKRRATREHSLYKIVARKHGVFSAEMREHLLARLRKNLVDGAIKGKAPERAIHIRSKVSEQVASESSN